MKTGYFTSRSLPRTNVERQNSGVRIQKSEWDKAETYLLFFFYSEF